MKTRQKYDLGFVVYSKPEEVLPSISEILASLTGLQKVAILDSFANKVPPVAGLWRKWMKENKPSVSNRAPSRMVAALYEEIINIKTWCKIEMLGQRETKSAVIDMETGEELIPAEYNTPPTTITALRTIIATAFTDLFTTTEANAVVNKMVLWSAKNEAGEYVGTWTTYSNGING